MTTAIQSAPEDSDGANAVGIPRKIELVYVEEIPQMVSTLALTRLKNDCSSFGIDFPSQFLNQLIQAIGQLEIGKQESYLELLSPANALDDCVDGWVVQASIKRTFQENTSYVRIKIRPVFREFSSHSPHSIIPYSFLQQLRILVHDYNNISHIAQGYLTYVADNIAPNSESLEDLQGAIDAINRNTALTDKLSELTSTHDKSIKSLTQLDSLIYHLIDAMHPQVYQDRIQRIEGKYSYFLAGDEASLQLALGIVKEALPAGSFTLRSSIKEIDFESPTDLFMLLPGRYLHLEMASESPSKQSNGYMPSSEEMALATKIITSLGGEVEWQEVESENRKGTFSTCFKVYLPLMPQHDS